MINNRFYPLLVLAHGLLGPCALLKQRLALQRPTLTAGQSPYPRPGQSAAFLYRPDRLPGPSRIRDASAVGLWRAALGNGHRARTPGPLTA